MPEITADPGLSITYVVPLFAGRDSTPMNNSVVTFSIDKSPYLASSGCEGKCAHATINNDINSVDPFSLFREEEGDQGCDLFRFASTAHPFNILCDPEAEGIDEIIKYAGANGGRADGDEAVLAEMVWYLHLMPVDHGLLR